MNSLNTLYIEFLKSFNIPEEIAFVSFPILAFVVVMIAMIVLVLALVLAERKILAFLTQRKGPNRVGYWGLLQTLADAFKLLCKENITPIASDRVLFMIAPIVVFTPVLLALGILPYCSEFDLMSTSTNLIFYMVLAFIPVLGILLAGYASNNKYSIIGGIRSVIQALSYELPIVFSLLGLVVLSASLNLNEIIMAQASRFGLLTWYFIPSFVGFLVTFVAVIAELNRCPFDLPEAESELIAGYSTEYSGMRFALFYLSEYSMMFANAGLLTILFFGGYLSPFGVYVSSLIFGSEGLGTVLVSFEQLFWFFAKTFVIIFMFMLIRGTLPRLQSDKLIKFSWTILLPLSMLNLFVCMIVKFVGGLID